jgi:hypothetical protein
MLVRPESLRLGPVEAGAVPATVSGRRFIGPNALFAAGTDGGKVLEVVAPPDAARPGERVGILPSRRSGAGIHFFQAEPA